MDIQFRLRPSLRVVPLALGLPLFLGGCGGGESSETPGVTSTADAGGPGSSAAPSSSGQGQALAPPTDPALDLFQKGLEYTEKGEHQAAADHYRRAVEKNPDMHEAQFALGKVLVHLSYVVVGSGAREMEVLNEGIAALGKAVELVPDNADYAYWQGRALHLAGRSDEAVEALKRATQLDPTHGLAHKRLGLVHADAGRAEDARASFASATEHLSDDAGVYFQYGLQLEAAEELEAARDAFDRAIEIDRTLPGPYAKLATVHERLGDSDAAAAATRDFQVWKNFDDQLKEKRRRANQSSNDPQALLEVGEAYFAAGKWTDSLEWLRRSLAIDSQNPLTHLYSGIVSRELGEHTLALNHLQEAAFLAPESVEPQLELMKLHVAMGSPAEVDPILTALDAGIPEDNVDDRMALAAVLIEIGRSEDAAERYRAILESFPQNADARAGLAQATGEDGQ